MTENVVASTAVPKNLSETTALLIHWYSSGLTYDVCTGWDGIESRSQQLKDRYSDQMKGRPLIVIRAREGQDIHDLINQFTESWTNHPWSGQDWFIENYDRWALHMIHASKTQPGRLSYYQSEDKRSRQIETPIKPGRYLKKFFSDILTEDQIQQLGLEFETWAIPPKVHITQDADEIEQVYVKGPDSCMAYGPAHFEGFCHPARVYAGPDLAIAYTGSLASPEARAVIWPDRKIFSAIYGDHIRLRMALEAQGYREGEVDNARIQRLYDDRIHCYVVPYVDGEEYATDEGDYLRIGSGHIYLSWTNGTSEEDPMPYEDCDHCEEAFDEDDLIYIQSLEQSCCPSCTHELTFRCDHTYDRHPREEARSGPHGVQYGPDVPVTYCDRSEVYFLTDYNTFYAMSNGETWVGHEFHLHGYTDAEGIHHPNPPLAEAA